MSNGPGTLKDTPENESKAENTDVVSKREMVISISAIVVTVILCGVALYYKDAIMSQATSLGYSLFGILVISFLAGSILSFTAVPIPYWLLVFTLPSVLAARWGMLAPFGVGLTSALGATLGHMPTFMVGYSGQSISRRISSKFNSSRYTRWYQRVIKWSEKHGWIAVFLTSALFNPIHLPLTVAFGTLRYPPWKFFIFSLVGNAVKSLFLAFAGYFGITSLLKFLGI